MENLFLNKDLVTGNSLTVDGVLAYTALRIIIDESIPLYNQTNTVDCVSVNRLAYALVGDMDYEKVLIDSLVRGIAELSCGKWISIRKDLSTKASYEYVLDLSAMWLDTDKDKFIIVSPNEVYKIMTCNEKMDKKIRMLKYFMALISTFDWALDSKIGHMSQQFIADQADNSVRTCQRYNDILEEMEMIFVYKSNDKVRINDKLKQIKNCYSRYEDKYACEQYASNYENMYGVEHKIVQSKKNKSQADHNRRLGAIYNQICFNNTDYDKETIKEVYKYINNKNKALQDEIDAKYAQTYLTDSDKAYIEGLEAQKRDISVFEQFDFLNVNTQDVNTDDWGEQIDFSVEEILDMPTVCEVQRHLAKKGSVADSVLHGEVDKPKMDSETVLPNSVKRDDLEQFSQKSSTTDDLETIDIDSLFDEDTDNKNVLSEEEAWELFA